MVNFSSKPNNELQQLAVCFSYLPLPVVATFPSTLLIAIITITIIIIVVDVVVVVVAVVIIIRSP